MTHRTCRITNCQRTATAGGLCASCYAYRLAWGLL